MRIVSIGSTPTMTHAEDETSVTEIRAGVYALGDLFMMNLGVVPMDRIAGTVLCTVIGHQPEKGQVIVDAGLDGHVPRPRHRPPALRLRLRPRLRR